MAKENPVVSVSLTPRSLEMLEDLCERLNTNPLFDAVDSDGSTVPWTPARLMRACLTPCLKPLEAAADLFTDKTVRPVRVQMNGIVLASGVSKESISMEVASTHLALLSLLFPTAVLDVGTSVARGGERLREWRNRHQAALVAGGREDLLK